jgi:glyoxylase-like metal-dependent hydrolase (beta-lactamase superfamily II)
MDFTRRTALAGAAAAVAVSQFELTPAFAQAPATPSSGVFRYKLGDAEVIQVLEGIAVFPIPDGFLSNVSKEKAAEMLEAIHMPKGQVVNPFCPSVIKAGGKTIVIDTGNGIGAQQATKGALGHHRANLAAAGIDVKDVNIVLISHFHGDHIGGLKNPDGSPAYPNAEIMVPATEWAFFMNDANLDKASPTNKRNFENSKKVFSGLKATQFEAGKEVAPGITAIATPGHTPGHTSFVVASGAKRVLIQGDVALVPEVFVRSPEMHLLFDNEKDAAVATRKKVFDMALTEKMPIIGYHFPFATVNYVEKSGSGYRLIAAQGGAA